MVDGAAVTERPLVAFLRARWDEAEYAAAVGLQGRTWTSPCTGVVDLSLGEGIEDLLAIGDRWVAEHIERYDPAWVLADIAAKRKILEEVEGFIDEADTDDYLPDDVRNANKATANAIIRWLVEPYADHPDYPKERQP